MANHKSAKKAIRQTVRKTAVNRNRVTRIRTYVRKLEEAITSGDKAVAGEAFVKAQSELMRGVTKRILKLETASRKVSRLAAKVKALASK